MARNYKRDSNGRFAGGGGGGSKRRSKRPKSSNQGGGIQDGPIPSRKSSLSAQRNFRQQFNLSMNKITALKDAGKKVPNSLISQARLARAAIKANGGKPPSMNI